MPFSSWLRGKHTSSSGFSFSQRSGVPGISCLLIEPVSCEASSRKLLDLFDLISEVPEWRVSSLPLLIHNRPQREIRQVTRPLLATKSKLEKMFSGNRRLVNNGSLPRMIKLILNLWFGFIRPGNGQLQSVLRHSKLSQRRGGKLPASALFKLPFQTPHGELPWRRFSRCPATSEAGGLNSIWDRIDSNGMLYLIVSIHELLACAEAGMARWGRCWARQSLQHLGKNGGRLVYTLGVWTIGDAQAWAKGGKSKECLLTTSLNCWCSIEYNARSNGSWGRSLNEIQNMQGAQSPF